MTLPENTILENRYRVDGLIAHGGNGAIYRAFDLDIAAPVAIKENFLQSPLHVAQFAQEAKVLAQLHHPLLPQVTHHFSFEGEQYLVMDYIEGENLWALVNRRGKPLAEAEALHFFLQVCEAVSYLHQLSPPFIHRDIKPRNIIVTRQGQAILVDFGIAKQIADEDSYAQDGPLGVVPKFSSPEQYSGVGLSPASDIYSLGATLYAVLTAQLPPNCVSRLVGDATLTSPNRLNPQLSPQTAEAVVAAMALKPEGRPQSVVDWAATLQAIADSGPAFRKKSSFALVATAAPALANREPKVITPSTPAIPKTFYWLIDSTGVGYPVGQEPLTIGSQASADVVIPEANVAPHHTYVRVEDQHCYVLDTGSPEGTYLNGHRLPSEWYPLNQGDILIIASARFYLTATQPTRLALPKASNAEEGSVPIPSQFYPEAARSALSALSPTRLGPMARLAVALLLLLLVALAVWGYFQLDPETLANLTVAGSSQIDSEADLTQTAAAVAPTQTLQAATQMTAQAREVADATRLAENAAETRQAEADATSQSSQPATSTPETVVLPTKIITPTSAAITPTVTVTVTATQSFSPTVVTPTLSAPPTRAPAGPTLIPLQSRDSVDTIGGQQVIDVDINPKNPREIYTLVKGDGIYKSTNGGDGPWFRIDLDGSSITSLVIDPRDPTRMYAATWNAVLKTTDGGNTWDPKTEGLVANQVVDIVVIHPADPDILYASIGETLVVSTNGGESWSSLGYGEGLGLERIYAIVVDPFDNNTLYIGGLAAAIYRSQDSGQRFVQLGYNVGKGIFGMAAHPRQQGVYLAGTNSGTAGIVKAEDGNDFRSASTGLIYGGGDSAYSAIAYAPTNPDIVYAGSGYESNPDSKGIFKSTDGGETWFGATNGLRVNQDTGFPYYVKSITVHPTNPNVVFAATGSGLYKTTDGGTTWALK